MPGHDVILHPTDGTETSQAALEEALVLAAAFDARLEVLSVVDVTAFPGSPSQAAIHRVESAAESAVERAVAVAEDAGVPVESWVEHGAAVTTIVRNTDGGDAVHDDGGGQATAGDDEEGTADTAAADLVVMGTHGRTGVEHYLVGSVAEHTVRESTVPVVVVPGPE